MKASFSTTTLAIDPGITNTGWAVEAKGEKGVQSATCITSSKDRLTDRMYSITDRLPELAVDTLIVEEFNGTFGINTKYLIGHLIGYIQAKFTVLVSNQRWRKDLLKVHASEEASELLLKKYPKAKTQHEADALGLLDWWKEYGTLYIQDKPKKVGI